MIWVPIRRSISRFSMRAIKSAAWSGPATVSLIGILLGLLVLALAFRGGAPTEETVQTDGSSPKRMALRFAGVVIAFGLFLLALHYVGFLIAIILLTFTMVLMTGERSYRVWIALISVGAPVLLLLFFNSALGTQFPKGALLKTLGF